MGAVVGSNFAEMDTSFEDVEDEDFEGGTI